MKPGGQKPHWMAPAAAKALNRRTPIGSLASPSTVVTSAPCTDPTVARQAQTVLPSTITVQAPHSPSPHPYLVPRKPSSSRTTVRSGVRGSTWQSRTAPLTVRLSVGWAALGKERLQDHFGKDRKTGKPDAGRIMDGVRDRGGYRRQADLRDPAHTQRIAFVGRLEESGFKPRRHVLDR